MFILFNTKPQAHLYRHLLVCVCVCVCVCARARVVVVGGRVTLGVGERFAATVATVTSTTTVLGGRSRQKVTDAAAAVVAALGRQSLDLTLAFTGS